LVAREEAVGGFGGRGVMSWLDCPTHAGWWLGQPPEVDEQVFLSFCPRKYEPGLWAWVPKRLLYPEGDYGFAVELVDAESGAFWGWEFKDLAVPDAWDPAWEDEDE